MHMNERAPGRENISPEQAILQACVGRFDAAYNDLQGFDHIAVIETEWGRAECVALNPDDLLPDEYNCRYAINRRALDSTVIGFAKGDEDIDIEFIIMETMLPKGDVRLVSELTGADIPNSFIYFVSKTGSMHEFGTLRELSKDETLDLARRLDRTRVSPDLPDWIKSANKLPQGPAKS